MTWKVNQERAGEKYFEENVCLHFLFEIHKFVRLSLDEDLE